MADLGDYNVKIQGIIPNGESRFKYLLVQIMETVPDGGGGGDGGEGGIIAIPVRTFPGYVVN